MVETEHQSRGGGPVRNCIVIVVALFYSVVHMECSLQLQRVVP
jgi:hypothetical protein